jgi:hypothetical protein
MMHYNQFNLVDNKFHLPNHLYKQIQMHAKEIKLFLQKIFLLQTMEQKEEHIKEKHLYHLEMEGKAHFFQLTLMVKICRYNH